MKHYTDIVFNTGGLPQAGVTVTVKLAGTNTSATLYSDDGVTPTSNPVTTSGLGRFGFYVADGRYDLVFAGVGIASFTLSDIEIADMLEKNSGDTSSNITAASLTATSLTATTLTATSATLTSATVPTLSTTAITANSLCKVVYAAGYGVVGDGVTDNTTALQACLNAAGQNSIVVLPTGTILLTQATTIFAYDGQWIQGAGKYATVLKRGNSVNFAGGIVVLAAGGGFGTTGNATFSDFTIDGNQANQTTWAGSLAGGVINRLTVQRMRFINSGNDAVIASTSGTDILIEDSDFESNVHNVATGSSDIRILKPLRVRILHNRFVSSAGLGCIAFTSDTGVGQVEVANNVMTGFTGYAVALGGGATNNAVGANIHDNIIAGASSNQNLIDLAAWSDIQVHHNFFPSSGTFSAVGDLPPANNVLVDSNVILASSAGSQATGIGLGGSNLVVSNNYVQGAGASGIAIAVANTGPSKRVIIANNISKNNNQNTPANNKAGIELFINSGGTGALSDVIIKGNHCYDDQGSPTQKYGVAIALVGQTTGYSNISIEGNDLRGNVTSAVLNSSSGTTGLTIRGNQGLNPVGSVTAPTFPASAAVTTNNTGYDCTVYITSGTNAITAVAIGGTTLTGVTVGAAGGIGIVRLPALQTITLTYTAGGSPSWQWIAD